MKAALKLSGFRSFNQWYEATGLNRTTFFQISSGTCVPSVDKAVIIARAAGLTVEQIWGYIADGHYKEMARTADKASGPGTTKPNERKTADGKPVG